MTNVTVPASLTASIAGRSVLLAGLFSLAALVALFYPFPSLHDSRVWQAWMDFCHFPLFVAWQIFMVMALRRLGWRRPVLSSALILLVLAACVEYLQGYFNRTPSLDDWITGAIAVAVGSWLSYWLKVAKPVRAGMVAVVLAGMLWSAFPALRYCVLMARDRDQFPRLLVLQPRQLPAFWQPLPDESQPTAVLNVAPCNDRWCLVVTTIANAYSGVSRYFDGSDWSGYRSLEIEVQSAQPLQLWVRIDDNRPAPGFKQRYNHEWTFTGGQHVLRLPLQGKNGIEQAVNLRRVHRLALFVDPASHPVSFRLLRVTLR